MERITCASCGKRYDHAERELCPRCGAFNPLPRIVTASQGESAPPAPEKRAASRQRKRSRAALEEGGLMLGLEVAADLAVDLLGDALSDLF